VLEVFKFAGAVQETLSSDLKFDEMPKMFRGGGIWKGCCGNWYTRRGWGSRMTLIGRGRGRAIG